MANLGKKSEFWEMHVQAWKKGTDTQSEYCIKNKISQSAFSKWKNKLLPNDAKAHRVKQYKNKYFKNSKLSNGQIEGLFAAFLCDVPAKVAGNKLGISDASAYKYYDKIRNDFIEGALNYPHLFFGSGMLMILGAPPDVHKLTRRFKPINPSTKGREKLLYYALCNVLICHSFRKWTVSETYYFWFQGLRLYFLNHYAEDHGLSEDDWDMGMAVKMQNKVSLIKMTISTWMDWIKDGGGRTPFSKDVWDAMRHQHEYHADGEAWLKSMLHDLKWVVERNNNLRRSTYWDFFKPSSAGIFEVNDRIHDYLKGLDNK